MSTEEIWCVNSRVGARIRANRPDERSSFLALSPLVGLLSKEGLESVRMRCNIGKRYARVFPEPVSAWMKASESSRSSWVIAAFCIAVGAVRERLCVKWLERKGERPREAKEDALAERGAFEGSGAGLCSVCACVEAEDFELGLYVKREETTSFGFLLDMDVVPLSLCFFAGLGS